MVSQGLRSREQPEAVPHLFGIPRHRIGRAVRCFLAIPAHRFSTDGRARAFNDELAVWDLAGFIYGKHYFRKEQYYKTQN